MTLIRQTKSVQDPNSVLYNAFGSMNVASKKKLFDGKIAGADDLNVWDNVGTGSFTYNNNTINMSVNAGQYCVSQAKRNAPYFSGDPQFIEITLDGFQTEADVVKRFGAFTSSAVAPYDTDYDGYWIENDNGAISMKSANNGTITTNKAFPSWTNYALIQSYGWSSFTVAVIEYLWLGGAAYKLWLVSPIYGWVLANDNSAQWVGTNAGTICSSPNKKVRYEIRSTTGTGSLKRICSQISTNNSEFDAGQGDALINPSLLTMNTVGTHYAMIGMRMNTTYRDVCTKISGMSCNLATSDSGVLYLVINPTLSAPLTYSAYNKIDAAYATTQTITPGTGRIISAKSVGVNSSGAETFNSDYLSWLSSTITNVHDQFVLVYTPITANQSGSAIINFKTLN